MEIHLKPSKLNILRKKLGFDCVFKVDPMGRSGVLMLFWSPEIQLEIVNYSLSQSMDAFMALLVIQDGF